MLNCQNLKKAKVKYQNFVYQGPSKVSNIKPDLWIKCKLASQYTASMHNRSDLNRTVIREQSFNMPGGGVVKIGVY